MRETEGPVSVPGLYYTNYYTNVLREGVLHRLSRLALHIRQHVAVRVEGYSYASVPNISETIFGFTFLPRRSVAHVCRRSWKRICGSPARFRSGLNLWVVT
jgi:hypothetical protein